jgi:AcrR family transcriptional regulator
MPRPRFLKLPAQRRLHILETAARVFSTYGFADASINAILEQAGVSKGAAYYYFDDKQDLFLTVVQHFSRDLVHFDELDISSLTRETYWPCLLDFYCKPLLRARNHPWAFGVLRAADALQRAGPTQGPLGAFVTELLEFARAVFRQGRHLGVVRTDIPEELLMAWIHSLDDANDRWILEHWAEFDDRGLRDAAAWYIDGLRRLIGPPNYTGD